MLITKLDTITTKVTGVRFSHNGSTDHKCIFRAVIPLSGEYMCEFAANGFVHYLSGKSLTPIASYPLHDGGL